MNIYTQNFTLNSQHTFCIQADEHNILAVKFKAEEENPNKITNLGIKQLKEFFAGKRLSFDLPLKTYGTEFQNKVWSELAKVPYGQTMNYQELAIKVANKNYARAIGMACNKNPIPIFIPCHRVIGSNTKLTGYAGGVELKQKLLELENIII